MLHQSLSKASPIDFGMQSVFIHAPCNLLKQRKTVFILQSIAKSVAIPMGTAI